ncbi:hypothetical protein V2J09_006630 [Rumex salicifolius]
MARSRTLKFAVRRREPELVPPARPTPREIKPLSDIDDQEAVRFHMPVLHVYRKPPGQFSDPMELIRKAVAEALVYYYPLAGRLREVDGKMLAVDCTGEGVMLVAAEADVSLTEFEDDDFFPPFPCWQELLSDVHGSSSIFHSPILLFQVTRLLCGGVIVGVRLNHAVCDATGLLLFINATAEIARGASQPRILPVWNREVLSARSPPRVTRTHREYEDLSVAITASIPVDELRCRSFFFGPEEISSLRNLVSRDFHGNYSTFDLLTASIWRCRTLALQFHPNEEVRAVMTVNARTRMNPPLTGYYGNAFGYTAAISTAKNITQNPLDYSLRLVKEAKAAIIEEHMRSVADLMVTRGRPKLRAVQPHCYLVSDSRGGFDRVDFGWGIPVYGGPANAKVSSFMMTYVSRKGESGVVVSVCLPPSAFQRFEVVLGGLLKQGNEFTARRNPNSSL